MSFINPSGDTKKVSDVQTANSAAVSVETKGTEVPKPDERKYTGVEMEQIVKDRLTRERKKFDKEKAEWTKAPPEPVAPKAEDKQVHPNIEQEFNRKLTDYETKNKALADQLGKYREQTLNATVERELVAQGCIDSEVVFDHFKSRKLVGLDDDGNVVVENTSGKLEDLVRDYLSQKPHLKRAESVGGLGTKGPRLAVGATSEKDQLLAQINASRNTTKLFGR